MFSIVVDGWSLKDAHYVAFPVKYSFDKNMDMRRYCLDSPGWEMRKVLMLRTTMTT